MTGMDDPCEPPQRPEVELNGVEPGVERLMERVTRYLVERGLLRRGERV